MVTGELEAIEAGYFKIVCSTPLESDSQLPWTEKFAIGAMGQTVKQELELAPDQLKVLKERAIRVFVSPAMGFAVFSALEGKN